MARRPSITTESFIRKLQELVGDEYVLIGNYVKSSVKVRLRHNICGHEWDILPSNFTSTGHRCPRCSKNCVNTEIFANRVEEITNGEYSLIGEYINSETPCLLRHNICETEYFTKPDFFIRGSRCPSCNPKRNISHEEFAQKIYERYKDQIIILEEYKNVNNDILIFNNNCNHQYKTKPIYLYRNMPECPICKEDKRKEKEIEKQSKINNRDSLEFVQEEIKTSTDNKFKVLRFNSHKNDKAITVIHTICGKEFKTTRQKIKNEQKCPHCKKKQIKDHSSFLEAVSNITNNEFEIIEEYKSSNTKLKIKHKTCGNAFEVRPAKFLRKQTCPICSDYRNHAYTTEEFAEKISNQTNGEFQVIGQYTNLDTSIKCRHICGNEYEIRADSIMRKRSGDMCPVCAATISTGEFRIKQFLEKYGFIYKSQYSIYNCKNVYKLRFDFAIFHKEGPLKCLIEYDGEQHFKEIKYFKNSYNRTIENDKIKNQYCKNNDITLIRIPYWEKGNIEEILTQKLFYKLSLSKMFNLL